MKALIIGATGATGKKLVDQLLKDDDFSEIHVFVRTALDITDPKLKVHVVDFDHHNSWKNLIKGEVSFSCLGTTLKAAGSKEAQRKIDVDYQLNFAKDSKENGIDHFILVSSYGASSNSNVFYSKMKGELEDQIKLLNFNQLTIFQPGMLDRQDSERFGEILGKNLIGFFNKLGILTSQKPLPTEILAKAMIKAAKIKSNGISILKLSNIFSFANKVHQ